MRRLSFLFFLLLQTCSPVFADQITYPTVWSVNDTVTNVKLNNNNNAVSSVVNGNLDNTNMKTGYSLFQTVSVLPTAGTQGRVDFLTSDNSLNLDTGAAWVKTVTPSGTPATGYIPYYNGGWQLLAPGAQYLPIVSNGVSSLPSYQILPAAGGGTNANLSAAAQGAVPYFSSTGTMSALAAGTSGQFLKSQGAAANPVFADAALSLVSVTTITGAANSTDVTIAASNLYKVIIVLNGVSTDDTFVLRVNNSSGTEYYWLRTSVSNVTTPATALTSGDGATSITIGSMDAGSAVNKNLKADLTFNTFSVPSDVFYLNGQVIDSTTAGQRQFSQVYGAWNNASAPTSFRVLTSGGATFSGKIYLYKYAQS